MHTLNLIGCGRAARTLARLWHEAGWARIGGVINRTSDSARAACDFIGAGTPHAGLSDLPPADLWLLGVPDRAIAPVAQQLAQSGRVRRGDGVFHLSGATPAAALAALAEQGARVASVHPVMSFAEPARACVTFAGTLCGIEGEATLARELHDAVSVIGGEGFAVAAEHKLLYHAASVFASNFLVVTLDRAREAYTRAGVDDDVAVRLLAPLARGALDNVLALGGEAALTGPAARGDVELVRAQQAEVAAWDAPSGEAYAALSALALRLAAEKRD